MADDGRRIGKAWRNAGFAAVALGVLMVGTQGVLSAVARDECAPITAVSATYDAADDQAACVRK